MGMMKLMIINASQGCIQKYESLKSKLYKCNASIYFNKHCLKRQLTPTCANIKVPNTSPAYKHTQKKLPTIRIKDKIRNLHSKKQQINLQLYQLHIQHIIEEKLCKEIKSEYETLDKKLQNLTLAQKETPQQRHTFHPRVINNTEILFSNREMGLLHKGLKYNTHAKKKY